VELIVAGNAPAKNWLVQAWAKLSGSVIHVVTPAQAVAIAAQIRTTAAKYPRLTVEGLAAHLFQESWFDPNAINPNNQEGHLGDNAEAKFQRTDFGMAQVDGRFISGHPGMEGLSEAQEIALADSFVWAIEDMAATDNHNLTWADSWTKTTGTRWTANQLGFNAYNKGIQGTIQQIGAGGTPKYGVEVDNRATQYKTLITG
jgi:hypothetical protein